MSPRVELDLNGAPLAQGLSYRRDPAPENDAAVIPANAGDTRIPDSRNARVGTSPALSKPVEVLSIATRTVNANGQGVRKTSDVHRPGWLNRSVPHFEPGSTDE